MIPLIVSLLILVGVGGTAAVSDSATPGSLLFPVDQAVEKVRLVFAGEDRKVELKAKFAKERLDEVNELLSEDSDSDSNDDKDSRKGNVEEGLSFAINLISQIDQDSKSVDLISQLNALLTGLPEGTDLDVKVTGSGSSFLKVRSESEDGESKIKLEIKETGGGKTIIKTESEDGKQEVEMVNIDGSKFKMRIEDDGKLDIEVEDADDDGEDGDDSDDDDEDEEDDDKDEEDDGDDDSEVKDSN